MVQNPEDTLETTEPEPREAGEETPTKPEMVEITRNRYGALRRFETEDGWESKKLRKQLEGLQAKYDDLLAQSESATDLGDANRKVLQAAKLADEADKRNAAASEKEMRIQARELALEAADKYGLDAKELAEKFAGCETTLEMKEIIVDAAMEKRGTPSRGGVDAGAGRIGTPQGRDAFLKAYAAGETSDHATAKKYLEELQKGT